MKEKTKYPEGRDLFASKCSGCHKLPYPNKFTTAEWDSLLIPMKTKAKLTEKQRVMIYDWLTEKRVSAITSQE